MSRSVRALPYLIEASLVGMRTSSNSSHPAIMDMQRNRYREPRIISRFDCYWPRLCGDERDRVGGGAAIGPFLRSPRCGGGLLRNSTQTPLIYSTQPGAAARSSQTKRRML